MFLAFGPQAGSGKPLVVVAKIYQRLLDISLAYFSWFGSPFFLGLPALRLSEQSKAVAASLMEVASGLDELNKDAVLNDVNDNDELLAITNIVKNQDFMAK